MFDLFEDEAEAEVEAEVDAEEESGDATKKVSEYVADIRARNQGDFQVKSPGQAIKAHCLETCCCGSMTEVKLCQADGIRSKLCVLYPFRFGKNPFRTPREVTEEQRIAAAERFRTVRNRNK